MFLPFSLYNLFFGTCHNLKGYAKFLFVIYLTLGYDKFFILLCRFFRMNLPYFTKLCANKCSRERILMFTIKNQLLRS